MNAQYQIEESEKSLLDVYPSPAAILDAEGEILVVNARWEEFNGESPFFGKAKSEGSFFEYCKTAVEQGSDHALKLIMGLRMVLDSDRESYKLDIPGGSGEAKQWYRANIRNFKGELFVILFEEITGDVLTYHALRDSREQYRQQFEHSINGIIIGTPQGDIKDVNPAACDILGYSREELLEGGRKLIVDIEDPVNKSIWEERQENSKFAGEKEYIHKSGKKLQVSLTSVMYRNADGGYIIVNTFKDITERKAVESQLKSEQIFINASMESIPGIFYVVNEKREVVRWNRTLSEELGINDDEVDQFSVKDYVEREDLTKVNQTIKEVFESGSGTVIAGIKTSERGVRQYQLNGKRFEIDGKIYLVGTGLDVTDLLEAEKAKEANFRMMEQLFDNSPLGIVMIDQDNRVSRVNDGFQSMFGFSQQELLNKNVNELIARGDQLKEAACISNSAFEGEMDQLESVRYTKKGDPVPVLISTIPVRNNGEIISVYGVYVDLSEQKQMEEKISELFELEKSAREKAQKSLKENEVLLQEVHHRVKNNLAVIAGLLELQLMEENRRDVILKLSEVQSRIFSISKIHETLYQEKSVVNIRFDHYLDSFIDSLPQMGMDRKKATEINWETSELVLNLNQAVPFGLITNELLNIGFSEVEDDCEGSTCVRLNHTNGKVTLSIQGDCLNISGLANNRDSEKFQFKLIEILLQQLEGTLELNLEQKQIVVSFEKQTVRGSSSSFIGKDEERYENR